MQGNTTRAIIEGAKIIIIQFAKKYATNIFFCVLFISELFYILKKRPQLCGLF